MMIDVISGLTGFTVNAKMNGSKKPREGVASVVVVTHVDEDDLFVLWRTLEDNLVVENHGKDHNLVVGEMTLKGGQFG